MVTRTRTRVDGLRELGEALRALGDEVGLKIARSATGAAAQVIKKKARANITASPSIETRSLLESVITKRLGRRDSNLTSEHIVTVRGRGKVSKKTGKRQTQAPHAHFVEFGTVHMPAEPFLGPAMDRGNREALDAMTKRLKTGIEKAAARAAKGPTR